MKVGPAEISSVVFSSKNQFQLPKMLAKSVWDGVLEPSFEASNSW